MASPTCQCRVGWGKGRKQGQPVICGKPATVCLTATGSPAAPRHYCGACLEDYRNTFSMTLGDEMADAIFARNFTISPVRP